VLTTGAVVQTSDWDSAVPALLQAWYGGQDQGTAIARVLFGDVNPSGKLPVTYPVDEATMPVSAPEQFPGGGPGAGLDQQFSEGIFVGYRGYEERGLTPRYAFGHGLSYTTFEYSNLRITGGAPAAGSTAPATPLETTVTVRNTGAVAGTETVQVYAGKLPTEVPTTPKSLAGWGKVTLEPGASQDIAIQLDPQSLSYWDVEADAWQTPIGEVPIYVGSSSADIRLEGVGNSAPIAVMATAPPEAGKRQRRDVPSSLQSIRDQ
jgi:beta-glucosidase